MIAVIDYGMGNLRSVQKALERVGARAEITSDRGAIERARGLVLPGVGAFGACMQNLERYGLIEPIKEALRQKKPFLGICLGFQVLFSESEEFGCERGLDIFAGKVVGFRPQDGLKVPHMGWNRIEKKKESPFLEGIAGGEYVYFVHSYFAQPKDQSLVATTTPYGVSFASSIATDHLFACQFHPEKSQQIGLRILANFARFTEAR
ncbi:MAG TPA: imidazole glycerol phosphate synthase subunit HisH [Candidatus Acidoferrales bacterium]|nr:imidazole glycerol phosphate synthase subunit HisH [Candidatus Acidoferrales bacterium]